MKKILMICVLMALPLQFALAGFSMPKMPDTSKYSSKFKMPQAGGDSAKSLPKGVNFSKPSKAPVKPTYIPHVYLGGAGGYINWTVLGQADVFFPVLTRYDRVVYLYGQGRYSHDNEAWAKNPWTGTLGAGYRQIFSHEIVVGAYVLGDYCNTSLGHKIMEASPGIEALTQNWDFRINGYIPFGTKDWVHSYWASDLGDYSYLMPIKHNVFDAKYVFHSQTGYGADAEVGRKVCNIYHMPIKVFINGYYYNMPTNKKGVKDDKGTVYTEKEIGKNQDIYGVGARVTLDANTFLRFYASYAYDNHKSNSIMVGLRLSVNDIFNNRSHLDSDIDLQNRLFEPIERNFASIDNASTARETGGPDDKLAGPYIDILPPVPTPEYEKYQDVWYWDASKTPSNDQRIKGEPGTYENPFTAADFNKATLDKIAANAKSQGFADARLDFTPGAYNNFGGYMLFPAGITYSVIGVNNNLITPVNSAANRPLFMGALDIPAAYQIQNIQVQSSNHTGIKINSGANVDLENVDIDTVGTTGNDLVGLELNHVSAATINNSTIHVEAKKNTKDAIGISCMQTKSLTVNGGTIDVETSDGTTDNSNNAYGIKMDDGSHLTLKLNKEKQEGITLTAKDGGAYSANATGVQVGNNSTVDMEGGTIIANAANNNGDHSGNAYDVVAKGQNDVGIKGVQITIDKGAVITATGNGVGNYSGNAYGIMIGNAYVEQNNNGNITTNTVTVSGKSSITATGNVQGKDDKANCSGNAYGVLIGNAWKRIMDAGNASANITDNTVIVDSESSIDAEGNVGTDTSRVKDSGAILSGNGYGVLVGYASLGIHKSSGKSNAYIQGNMVKITENSKITGKGNADVTSTGSNVTSYSANGYGVVVGYGDVGIADKHISGVNLYISGNNIDIGNVNGNGNQTMVTGIGNMSYKKDDEGKNFNSYAGRGFGVLVGFGGLNDESGATNNNFIIGSNDGTKFGNSISLIDATLVSYSSNNSKRCWLVTKCLDALATNNIGYGLLVVYAGWCYFGDSDHGGVKNNIIYLMGNSKDDQGHIYIEATGVNTEGTIGAVGVEIGNYYKNGGERDSDNDVTTKNIAYNVDNSANVTNPAYYFGLYMPKDSGTLTWQYVPDQDWGGNSFVRTSNYQSAFGYGLYALDGGKDSSQWFPKWPPTSIKTNFKWFSNLQDLSKNKK